MSRHGFQTSHTSTCGIKDPNTKDEVWKIHLGLITIAICLVMLSLCACHIFTRMFKQEIGRRNTGHHFLAASVLPCSRTGELFSLAFFQRFARICRTNGTVGEVECTRLETLTPPYPQSLVSQLVNNFFVISLGWHHVQHGNPECWNSANLPAGCELSPATLTKQAIFFFFLQ